MIVNECQESHRLRRKPSNMEGWLLHPQQVIVAVPGQSKMSCSANRLAIGASVSLDED